MKFERQTPDMPGLLEVYACDGWALEVWQYMLGQHRVMLSWLRCSVLQPQF